MSGRFPAVLIILAALVFAKPAHATTRTVPSDFSTIQDAIDASSAGDTVAIHPGDYIESITVRDDLVILGSGPADTRIRGFSGATLTVDSLRTGVTVAGLTFRAAPGVVSTVYARPGSTPTFTDVVIDGGTIGLRAEGSSPRISASVIHACTVAISAEGSASPQFLGDVVSDNLLGASCSNGATPTFHQCRFERNGIYNLQVSSYSDATTIDASRNWWGTSDETQIATHIRVDGSGPVTVNYVPWCADPGCETTPTEPVTWGSLRIRFNNP